MDMLARAQALFAADRFSTDMGATIDHIGDHTATCSLTLTERHRNARGVAMGGAVFTLADFASAVAAHTDCLVSGEVKWVSLESSIHFLAPAAGQQLVATASPIKQGRQTALYHTLVCDATSGRQVAVVQTTMMNVASAPPAKS